MLRVVLVLLLVCVGCAWGSPLPRPTVREPLPPPPLPPLPPPPKPPEPEVRRVYAPAIHYQPYPVYPQFAPQFAPQYAPVFTPGFAPGYTPAFSAPAVGGSFCPGGA